MDGLHQEVRRCPAQLNTELAVSYEVLTKYGTPNGNRTRVTRMRI